MQAAISEGPILRAIRRVIASTGAAGSVRTLLGSSTVSGGIRPLGGSTISDVRLSNSRSTSQNAL